MTTIMMVVSIVSVLVNVIMIFAYIATKNAVIDIVTSFETQNSNSYEIRLKVFNRAIIFISNLESKSIDETTKKKELGQIFDSLLMVSTSKETLRLFEDIVKIYFDDSFIDQKKFNKFKACVRREFGAKKYSTKSIYRFTEPTGTISFGMFDERPPRPMPPMPNGMPMGARVNNPAKGPVPGGAPQVGATFVTSKAQETAPAQNIKPAGGTVSPAGGPVPPIGMGMRPVGQQNNVNAQTKPTMPGNIIATRTENKNNNDKE